MWKVTVLQICLLVRKLSNAIQKVSEDFPLLNFIAINEFDVCNEREATNFSRCERVDLMSNGKFLQRIME